MLRVSALTGFGVVQAEPPVATHAYGSTSTSFNVEANQPITFAGMSISTAAANRYIAVTLNMNIDQSMTVTVAGQACTKRVGTNNGFYFSEIWVTNAPVTTGTTATVELTGNHLSNARVVASTFALYGIDSPVPSASGVDTGSPYSISFTIPTNGVAIGAAVVSVLTSWTWSSFTEQVDAQLSPITYTAGSRATAGAITETVTPATGGTAVFVVAAWAPG